MTNFRIVTRLAFSLLISVSLHAQVSLSGGMGMINGFTSDNSFLGLHGGFELPSNNDITFYARVGHYFSQQDDNPGTSSVTLIDWTDNTMPFQLQVQNNSTFNYTTIEGGTRYYIGNDYDNGLSAYGGTNGMLVFNQVKIQHDKTDITGTYEWEDYYTLSTAGEDRGVWINIALGLQGGVKYSIPALGTVYFDVSGQYIILGQPNNLIAQSTNQFSQLFFVFTVGFRKDLY